MIYNKLVLALALSTSILDVAFAQKNGGARGGKGFGGAGAGAGAATTAAAAATSSVAAVSNTTAATGSDTAAAAGSSVLQLNPANVQNGSDSNGLADAEAGQAASATDPANFINFCTGKTLTNGLQVTGGSCNGIVMGNIPASTNMVSTIITFPQAGSTIPANTDFNFTLQTQNLVAGVFTNPDTTYYAAPQDLQAGNIIGHSHVTVQTLGDSINPTTPPDPATFVFFKGINDAGNGQGLLAAAVAGGLPAGIYRVCTLGSSANHQPLLMPVAQRGAQDDCTKFTVSDSGAAAASGTAAAPAATSAAASNATAATGGATAGAGKAAGKGGKAGKGRFAVREFIA